MKIIIFGASGKTGKLVVEKALQEDYTVTAFVREAAKLDIQHSNLTIIQGEATNEEAVKAAIAEHDAVISCLGSSSGLGKTTILHEMGKNIVNGMKANQVSRIVYMASAGVDKEIPGISGKIMMKLLANVLEDHRNALNEIKSNNLTYTIARPMGLTDKPFTGTYRETFTGVPGGSRTISRADVADFIIRSLEDEKYLNQSVALAD